MALVLRNRSSSSTKSKKGKPKLDLSLSDEPNEPSDRMQDYSWLIYGAKKIGKTSLASRFPNAYFLALEPGVRALRVKYSDVPDWDHFVGYVDLLEKQKDPELTTVVDVIDLAYEYIYDKICETEGIDNPTENNDYGATWRRIRKLFHQQIARIIAFPGGKIFLSHDTEKEVELRDGTTVDRVQPTMSKQALGCVEGIVDIVANYCYDEDNRVLRIDGSQTMVAGNRIEEHFIREGGKPRNPGDRIKAIPMGGSSQEAFDNLEAAFDNEQEYPEGKKPEPPRKSGLTLKKKSSK